MWSSSKPVTPLRQSSYNSFQFFFSLFQFSWQSIALYSKSLMDPYQNQKIKTKKNYQKNKTNHLRLSLPYNKPLFIFAIRNSNNRIKSNKISYHHNLNTKPRCIPTYTPMRFAYHLHPKSCTRKKGSSRPTQKRAMQNSHATTPRTETTIHQLLENSRPL